MTGRWLARFVLAAGLFSATGFAGGPPGDVPEEKWPGTKPVEVNRDTRLVEDALARALAEGGAPDPGAGDRASTAVSDLLQEARARSQASADAMQWIVDHWPT